MGRGTEPTFLVRLINRAKLSTVRTTTKMRASEIEITIWNNQICIYEHEIRRKSN